MNAQSTASGYTGNDLPTYRPDDFSDAGCSAVFARYARDCLMWTEERGHLFWTGAVWEANPSAAVGLGKSFTDRMLDEARRELIDARVQLSNAQASGDKMGMDAAQRAEESAKKYLAFAVKTRGQQRIKAFIELSKPDMLISGDRLDADPFLLNTPAGMIDLKTGELHPHAPGNYCTAITAVSPGDQGAELWSDSLRMVSCDDPDLMNFHQVAAGMKTIGRVFCENMLIDHGAGRNGKSTHDNIQMMVLGSGYAGTLTPEVLTTDKRNAGADLATLRGKRLVVIGELEEGKRLSTSVLKRLTSTDPITAERKYFAPETFMPTHTAVLYTNHLPRLGSTDTGTKRRIRVVPFSASVPAGVERKNYTQTLFEEAAPAVLAWMVEGARRFIANGFQLPRCSAVEEATSRYFDANDWMASFLDECCVVDPCQECSGSALYGAYSTRASAEGEYIRRGNDFASELEKLGFARRRTKAGVIWSGLSVRASLPSYGGYSP